MVLDLLSIWLALYSVGGGLVNNFCTTYLFADLPWDLCAVLPGDVLAVDVGGDLLGGGERVGAVLGPVQQLPPARRRLVWRREETETRTKSVKGWLLSLGCTGTPNLLYNKKTMNQWLWTYFLSIFSCDGLESFVALWFENPCRKLSKLTEE